MDSTYDEIISAGLAAHEAGDFSLAESKYREVLEADPENGDANHALGLLMIGLDKRTLSLSYLRAALDACPDRLHLWLDFFSALAAENRLPEAWDLLAQAREHALDSDLLDHIEADILLRMCEHNVSVLGKAERERGFPSSQSVV